MKTLKEYLADKQDITIHSVTTYINQYLKDTWKAVLLENQEELARKFAEFGDRAYGIYIQAFMAPIFKEIIQSDFIVKAGFNLSESIENWGSPEERERCIWYVIKQKDELLWVLLFYKYSTLICSLTFPRLPKPLR